MRTEKIKKETGTLPHIESPLLKACFGGFFTIPLWNYSDFSLEA